MPLLFCSSPRSSDPQIQGAKYSTVQYSIVRTTDPKYINCLIFQRITFESLTHLEPKTPITSESDSMIPQNPPFRACTVHTFPLLKRKKKTSPTCQATFFAFRFCPSFASLQHPPPVQTHTRMHAPFVPFTAQKAASLPIPSNVSGSHTVLRS